MIDDVQLRAAVPIVWSPYLVKHCDVDAAESRRLLVGSACERRRRTHWIRPGLPRSASRRRMLKFVEGLVGRMGVESARPDRVLLAIFQFASAVIVLVFRSMFPL